MFPRPSFRLPLWAAFAIAGAAYAVRSVVLRDGNFAPDMPSDLIVGTLLIAVVGIVAWTRRQGPPD